MLSQFTVGTIDQLLLMSVKQKHLFLRHLAFSGKVVVIDEVHANDSFMNQHLFKALNWLGAYHVPVIALSATLPKETRVNLLAAYYRGRFGKSIKHAEAPENWQETQSYPLLTMLDGKQVKQVTEFGNEQTPVTVKVNRLDQTNEELMNSILNKIKKGGIAGIIVDTIREAQELGRLVPDDVPHLVLHSAFLAGERASKEATLQEKIGKNGHRPDKMIVIGTQVLEQSLDIDFDVLYTDIAPMDLLLQRIGRLHRHHIQRPDELRQPEVFIMGIEAFGKYRAGISFIYENYLLMKTDYYLKDELTLPTDISPLVQQVYDFESNEEIPDLKKVKTQFDTHREKQESEAKAFQIGLPKQNCNPIHGWLKHPYDPQNADEKSGAVVRDIQETLEVILVKQIGSECFTLSGTRISDMSDMAIAEQTIRLPVRVTQNMGNVVSKLLGQTNRFFANWKESKWLKESYALVLDQDQSAILDGWQLRYSSDWGLSYKKEE
ncbi:CRISPR-associated helicase Cas3' [Secundilactobacillus paracollinoides]|uniref:CRISPR-associated helicase Cas3' n=1 Tax=Secundilactobacillus paracollinoides TaxID=240427 RepID=UPI001CDAE711|nr:CRISPR-associated helicase Cas3' [Secundilactobacillus paracollinoides]